MFETVHGNIFDDIGTPSINNCTLSNGSGVINRFIFKVRKLSVTISIVAFTASSIIQLCVHIPIKHSETDCNQLNFMLDMLCVLLSVHLVLPVCILHV